MRASTVFSGSSLSRHGNWSEAEEIPITIVPAPTDIQVHIVGIVPEFRTDEISINFIIDVQWSPGARRKRQTSLTPTGYQVALGTEPIEVPFGDVPMDTVTEQFVSVSFCLTATITVATFKSGYCLSRYNVKEGYCNNFMQHKVS